jgi:hypothetical protein
VHQTAVVVVDGGGFGSPSHQRAAKWLFARPSLTYYHPLSKATAHKKSPFYCAPPPTWPRRLILSAGRPIVKSFGRSDGGFAQLFVCRWPFIVKKLGPERERCDQRRGKHSPNFAQRPSCKITFLFLFLKQ